MAIGQLRDKQQKMIDLKYREGWKPYYEGGLWLGDYEADKKGLIPGGTKRGFFSQDALYDFLEKAEEAKQKNGGKTNE